MIHRRYVALGLVSAAAALLAPSVASAASRVDINDNAIASTSENLGSYSLTGKDVLGLTDWDVDVTSKASWSGNLTTHVLWDDSKVRQNTTLAVTRMTPMMYGDIDVSWKVSGSIKAFDFPRAGISTKNITVSASCPPMTAGSGFDCTATSPGIYLMKTPGLPASPYVKLILKARFHVTPEGAIVDRSMSLLPAATNLPLSPMIATETVKLPCGPIGSAVSYKLGNIRYTPAVSVTQQPAIRVGLMDPVLGLAESPALLDKPFGPAIKSTPAFALTGAGHATDLGDLLMGGC
jgi:hypothetical protein